MCGRRKDSKGIQHSVIERESIFLKTEGILKYQCTLALSCFVFNSYYTLSS